MVRKPHQLFGTLLDLVERGYGLMVHCEVCQHRAQADVPALISANGPRYPVETFIEHAICPKCGARWPKLRVTVIPPAPQG